MTIHIHLVIEFVGIYIILYCHHKMIDFLIDKLYLIPRCNYFWTERMCCVDTDWNTSYLVCASYRCSAEFHYEITRLCLDRKRKIKTIKFYSQHEYF